MLAACDIYRPAAIDQLEVVGKSVDVPVFTDRGSNKAEDIALKARKEAESNFCRDFNYDGRNRSDER